MGGLRIHGLACTLGHRELFRDLELELEPGRWVMLTGDNGAGKSTLLRLVAGLVSPTAGRFSWDGQAQSPRDAAWRQRTLYQGHASGWKDSLDPVENLQLQCLLDHGLEPQAVPLAAIRDALARVGLSRQQKLPMMRLSAGQRRRIGLARLVLSRHTVWLLDEPTTALDHEGQQLFARLLDEHLARGGCALVATHLPLDTAQAPQRRQLQERRLQALAA